MASRRPAPLKALLFTRDDQGNLRVHGPVTAEKARVLRCEFVLLLEDSSKRDALAVDVLTFRQAAEHSGLGLRAVAFLDEVLVLGHPALKQTNDKDLVPEFLTVVFDGLAGASAQFVTMNGDTPDNPELM